MNIFAVVPTYNEAANIKLLVPQLFSLYPMLNVLVVDDNSPDGTGKIADDLCAQFANIHVLHRPSKLGLGTAYIEGFGEALRLGADLIIEMDADFSHNPKYIVDLISASESADLVIGSRYLDGVRVEGWRFRRLMLSKFANMFVSYTIVKPIWDFTSGFRCYRSSVLAGINMGEIKSDGYAFQIEMTYLAIRHGFKVTEIPIIFRDRKHGQSKISKKIIWEAFWVTLRCRAPIIEIIKHLKYLFKELEPTEA
jgi:dolichol-phosphate mannosyltransferase